MVASHLSLCLWALRESIDGLCGGRELEVLRLLELLCEHFSQEKIRYSPIIKFSNGPVTHLIKEHFSKCILWTLCSPYLLWGRCDIYFTLLVNNFISQQSGMSKVFISTLWPVSNKTEHLSRGCQLTKRMTLKKVPSTPLAGILQL